MGKKIPNETIDLMQDLYSRGLSVTAVAKRANVPYSTAWSYTAAKQRGFASRGEYEAHLAKQRQQQPINQKLSDLIKQRLAELGKSQKWLSIQLRITEGAVSRYLSGRTTPRRNLQERLFETLELPYQTLEDLVE